MKRLLLSFLIFTAHHCSAQQNNYWQQKLDYTISVSLDDTAHTLDGYLQLQYQNNSPDTLSFIWFHLWPNAYKNDRTAFSDQLLENGRTDFYFSNEKDRGYINRLNFIVNKIPALTTDHPQEQDIIKLILPQPLAPGKSVLIETPFHEKIPAQFSRSGHAGQSYQVTQWYPKPAVYDRKGWHPIPYLDQGEFYSEFGNFNVAIELPENYIVAATGEVQEKNYIDKLFAKAAADKATLAAIDLKSGGKDFTAVPSAAARMTLHYRQENVHDFAWFADKQFSLLQDTLALPSGRIIRVSAFFYEENKALWKNSISMIKQSILTKSRWLGEYPYNTVSVVEQHVGGNGGMEYPTVTLISTPENEQLLDFVINHEVGHNWFYGILASNERQHPWMDEGMNTFYDNRYNKEKYGVDGADILLTKNNFIAKRLPEDLTRNILATIIAEKKDQPIETTSSAFNETNYNLVAYTKTGQWMQMMEQQIGTAKFDAMMQAYYQRWKFKHPYPEDFRAVVNEYSNSNTDSLFGLLQQKGSLLPKQKKDLRFVSFFSLKDTDKHRYISAAPVLGYNFYDKVMIGAVLHNYTLPIPALHFFAAPMYALGSKEINGLGRIGYSLFPGKKDAKLEISISAAKFTINEFSDSSGRKNYQPFSKVVPSLKYFFANRDPRSTIKKYLQWKTFLVRETGLAFNRDTINQVDVISYPVNKRYLNELKFVVENNRKLYPFAATLQVQQGKGFARTDITGNYFFNYANGGGLSARLFAGKFIYTGDKTFTTQFETDPFHLNMTGARGYEDYTFSNYFYGRNEFKGFASQQIMIRDGAFKVRTDLLSSKIGKTDDWLAAMNFATTIPRQINPLEVLPVKIPLRIFADVGTYAEAWKKDAASGRFLYDAGLQLSLFKNVLNIYMPILYSKVYDNYFKSTITEKRFIKNISFSIDIQNIGLDKMVPQLNL
ncbi:MAG: family metallopeptidase [Ferruginibacter sp.]|nr:family metallopeptidase [Ferruginibacter sp.]